MKWRNLLVNNIETGIPYRNNGSCYDQLRYKIDFEEYFAEDIPVMESRELDLTKYIS